MKKLLILLFSLLVSFNSYGELVEVTDNTRGDTFYIYTDTIKKYEGYVYWWDMVNYLKPKSTGDFSVKYYNQGDCGINRYKTLSNIFYKQPMGNGESEISNWGTDWKYPSPGITSYIILSKVCDYVK